MGSVALGGGGVSYANHAGACVCCSNMKPSGPIAVAVTDSEVRLLALALTYVNACLAGVVSPYQSFEVAATAAQTVLPCGAWKGITQRKLAGHMPLLW